MNFEDVGRVWREQRTGDFQRRKIESLSTVRGRANKLLNRIQRNGTWIGGLTMILLLLVLVRAVIDAPRPWMAGTGCAILMAWLVRLLIRFRRFGPPRSGSSLPVRAAVESEVSRLRLLEQFWGRLHRGFPMFLVGEILGFEGFRPVGAERGPMTVGFYIALFALVVYAVAARGRDARTKVRPLREDLESWLAGLEAFEYDGAADAEPEGGMS